MTFPSSIRFMPFLVLALLAGCDSSEPVDDSDNMVDPDSGTPNLDDAGTKPNPSAAEPTFTTSLTQQREGYTYKHLVFRQPEVHGKSTKLTITQHVNIVIPDGVNLATAPVYFLFDNEEASTLEDLLKKTAVPRFLQAKMIYIAAEHRGYGKSLSDDADQSVPKYVTPENAIDDAHAVISALKKEFKGSWVVVGYSYGGGLVVQFGATYPKDAKVIVSSSGVMHFDTQVQEYEGYIRQAYGDAGYLKLIALMQNFKDAKPFDQDWQDREMLEGGIVGLTQYAWAQPLLPAVVTLLDQSKEEVLEAVRAIDKASADDQAANYAYARSRKTVTRKDMLARDLGMRVYLYQQCTRLGVFHVSPGANGGVFGRDLADHQAECEQTFGAANVPDLRAGDALWTPGDHLPAYGGTTPKLVYLRGGRDPWQSTGIETPNWIPRTEDEHTTVYDTYYGSYIDVPAGLHAPDFGDADVSLVMWTEINRLLDGDAN